MANQYFGNVSMTQIAAIQAPYNIMHLLGGEVQDITESAVDINASPTTQNTIEITDTTVARAVNLPQISSLGSGWRLIVKDGSGGAGTNNITLNAFAGDLIDGAATFVINTNYGSVTIYSNNTAGQWRVI